MNKRCIKYNECRALIYPDDPEAPKFRGIGNYLPSLCDSCYGYLPDIEPRQKPPQDVEVRHTYFHVDNSRRITAKLNALDGAVNYLLKKEEQKGGKKSKSYF